MYTAQYTQKDFKHGYVKSSKQSHSKHSGIGRDYFLKHYEQILLLGYVPVGGRKLPVPRYFEKLAHKHYSHFYAPENFQDLPSRKKLYRSFKPGQANSHMAELYKIYHNEKQIHIEELAAEWDNLIEEYAFTDEKPDFIKSAENYSHDLQNRKHYNQF